MITVGVRVHRILADKKQPDGSIEQEWIGRRCLEVTLPMSWGAIVFSTWRRRGGWGRWTDSRLGATARKDKQLSFHEMLAEVERVYGAREAMNVLIKVGQFNK